MSAVLSMAEAVANQLESVPLLAGVNVLVQRPKDVESKILESLEQSKGLAVLVVYRGGENLSEENDKTILKKADYVVLVYMVPTLRPEVAMESVCEEIQKALHGWAPTSGELAGHSKLCMTRMRYASDDNVTDDKLLIHANHFHINLRVK